MGEEENKELTRARNAAYRYLTYRPRSRAEMEAKLTDRGFRDVVVEEVLAGLIRLGYLNDETFAEQWAGSRIRTRGFGRRRIEQELREKGIDRDIVRRAISAVLDPEHERETAMKAAERKLRTLRHVDHETRRRRLAGFLERKGFPPGVIREVLQHAAQE